MAKRKKKNKKVVTKPKRSRRAPKPYELIVTRNNKQIEVLSTYTTEARAYQKFTQLLKEKENIAFPVHYYNGKKISEVKYELMLIKRREEGDPVETLVRNDYGEYVPHQTTSEKWIVLERAVYEREEEFWVYGFHPLTQRKNAFFIYNEMVLPKVKYREYFTNIYIFKNKLLIETSGSLDMVLCKNKHDSIRLYNLLNEWCIRDKCRYVLFSGDGGCTPRRKRECYKKIMDLTNWSYMKVARNTTNPS